jgi:hypothetical protein
MEAKPVVEEETAKAVLDAFEHEAGRDEALRRMAHEEPDLRALVEGAAGDVEGFMKLTGAPPALVAELTGLYRILGAAIYSAWRRGRAIQWESGRDA